MPRPITSNYAIPFALAEAAATAYVLREPDGSTFTDFFHANNLDNVTAFRQFCDPEQAAVEAGFIFDGETAAETVENLQVDYYLGDLMDAALNLDLRWPYRLGRVILRGEGVTDPGVMPIVQRSKRLGRQFGVTRNEVIFDTCLFGLNDYQLMRHSILKSKHDKEGRISELLIKPEAYARYVRPHVERSRGCPMIRRTVRSPHTGQKVNLYDLYWEVAVAHQHAELAKQGLLDTF